MDLRLPQIKWRIISFTNCPCQVKNSCLCFQRKPKPCTNISMTVRPFAGRGNGGSRGAALGNPHSGGADAMARGGAAARPAGAAGACRRPRRARRRHAGARGRPGSRHLSRRPRGHSSGPLCLRRRAGSSPASRAFPRSGGSGRESSPADTPQTRFTPLCRHIPRRRVDRPRRRGDMPSRADP